MTKKNREKMQQPQIKRETRVDNSRTQYCSRLDKFF